MPIDCSQKECFPYLCKPNDCNKPFHNLFSITGMPSELTIAKISEVLLQIRNDYNDNAISRDLIPLIRDLVSVVAEEIESGKQIDLQYYLPNKSFVMWKAEDMISEEDVKDEFYKRLLSIESSKTAILHPSISKHEAKYLGVKDLLRVILDDLIVNDFVEDDTFEQHESLMTRLNNLLKQYKANVTIFKEFIQNADDAEATEIAFILDHSCNYPDNTLSESRRELPDDWKLLQKVPSLLVVNNRKFEEKDFKGISQLGLGTKREDADKIGRFGIGFNVAYHVTDCPQFVSYGKGGVPENFCVFDPNEHFLTKPLLASRAPRGRRLRLSKMRDGVYAYEHFADQFTPFLQNQLSEVSSVIHGCFTEALPPDPWPNGYVVFRLPLTRSCSALNLSTRLINGECMNTKMLLNCIKNLKSIAHSMLLFLTHIKRISVFVVNPDGKIVNPWSIQAKHQECRCQDILLGISEMKVNLQSDDTIESFKGRASSCQLTMLTQPHQSDLCSKAEWILNKRIGGSDLSFQFYKKGYKENKVLPIVSVATAVNDLTSIGGLSSSLPIPGHLNIPVFIDSNFLIDSSRQFIDLQDTWNQELVCKILPSVYKDLLLKSKYKVDGSVDTVRWYYKRLFCHCEEQFHHPLLKDLPTNLFSLLLSEETDVLLADRGSDRDMEVSWFALTNDSECKQKGYFIPFCYDNLRSVLISLGMNITRAPGSLHRKLQCLIPNVKLEIDPAIIRQHLLHLNDWTNYRKTIIASIVPLLSYVLMDINQNNVEKLEGLPLILNDAGNLEQITLKCPLYCCEFIDLLPHCKESFISSTLYKETELYTKLVALKLIKPLDATFVAAHIDLSNDKIKYCGHEKIVCCLWRFILDSNFDFSEAMEILKDISCIPVNDGYIYPPREGKFILYNYGQVHLLQKLKNCQFYI